jgi:hypothetical protein
VSFPGAYWHNVLLIRAPAVLLLLALCACERAPIYYPPPEQRKPVEGAPFGSSSMMLEMDDPGISAHIVKDVYDSHDSPWRWTLQEPTFKLLAWSTAHVKLIADIALWPKAFQQTGPLELSFFVNGHLLDKVSYATPGPKHYEKPVPPDWLVTEVESTISFKVDKLYIAPADGTKYGVILSRIGLLR